MLGVGEETMENLNKKNFNIILFYRVLEIQ